MEEYESEDLDTIRYRMAAHQFEFAFESCKRLPPEYQELLLRDIAKRILEHMPVAQPEPIVPVAESEKPGVVNVLGVDITLDL